jgi:carbon-monoxide dehydrogenase medium subunit
MYPFPFDYLDPVTVEQAIEYLQRHAEDDVKVLAGGQSLIPLMKLRFAQPSHLVDLGRVSALDYLRLDAGWLRIGALTRERALEDSAEVRRAFPILHDTASVIADPVVRNLATVGGNLAHADPANDHPATMVALGASVVATGPDGERVIPVEELFQGLFETVLAPDEILTEVRVPPLRPGTGAAYVKLERQAGDFAVAAVAARISVASGVVGDARLVYTGVGAIAQRVPEAERILVGSAPSGERFSAAGVAAGAAMDLDDDLRGSASYKRRVVRVVTERALRVAWRRAAGEEEP